LPLKVHIEIGAVNAPDPQSGIVITSDRSFVFTGSGDTAQLTVAVVGDDGRVDPSADTSFSSSNPDVVTVDPSGLLTAQSDDLGSAVITVSSGNLQPVVATAVVADLTPETVYLQNNDVIEVDADTGQVILVRTPKTEVLRSGDVLLSGDRAGLLHRVGTVSLQSDRVVVETTPANLTDAFENLVVEAAGAEVNYDAVVDDQRVSVATQPSELATQASLRGLKCERNGRA
jgi:hypothetical protein